MPSDKKIGGGDDSFIAFFSKTGNGKYVPRYVINDLETNTYFWSQDWYFQTTLSIRIVISGKEVDANNFFRGRYNIGKEIVNLFLDWIRKVADQCSGLQGFLVFYAVGYGTGSCLGSLLLKRLSLTTARNPKSDSLLPIHVDFKYCHRTIKLSAFHPFTPRTYWFRCYD